MTSEVIAEINKLPTEKERNQAFYDLMAYGNAVIKETIGPDGKSQFSLVDPFTTIDKK